MKLLFLHQNFPAQFYAIAENLAADPGNQVHAIGTETAREVPGVTLWRYTMPGGAAAQTHAFARSFDSDCRRAEQVMYLCTRIKAGGFTPDLIVVHTGWGEALPLKSLFPQAKIVAYVEMCYRPSGTDVNFDPEFPRLGLDGLVGLSARNAATLLALIECDAAIAPTEWQKSTFPEPLRSKIQVIHEGVDVDRVCPDPDASVTLPDGRRLRPGDPVVTFAARDLEPLRGYHSFMRALPHVLRSHPKAEVLIVGGEGTSYGALPPVGRSWKSIYFDEVSGDLDNRRVHFLGRLPYPRYLDVLRVSAAHVYLTYPFVLSWSLLEAMATGCVIVASSTPPVQEMIDEHNGILVEFFDPPGIALGVLEALNGNPRIESLRKRARNSVLTSYSRKYALDQVHIMIEEVTEFIN